MVYRMHKELIDHTNSAPKLLQEDLIWLAGFMDGEGSFSVRRLYVYNYLSYKSWVSVAGTNLDLMCDIIDMFKLYGKVHTSEQKERNNSRPSFTISLVSWATCANFCRDVYPFLRLKKRQAEILLKWGTDRIERMKQRGKTNIGWEDYEHKWYEELRKLNHRGTKELVL